MLAKFGAFIEASLGRRLALGMGTMLLAALAISTILFVRDERQEMRDILWQKSKTALNMTALRVARSIENNDDRHALREEIAPLLEDRDFDYAYVFDRQQVLAGVNDPDIAPGPHGALPTFEELRQERFTVRFPPGYMEVVTPVVVKGRMVAGLGLGVSLDLPAQQGRRVGRRLLVVTAALLTTALGFIYWWTRKAVAPLLALTRGAERIAQGDLSVRVPVTGVDEVGTLGSTFNQLAASLQHTLEEKDRMLSETSRLYRNLKVARARLGRAERLSAVGMLAAGVSHELNNPLGIILSTAGNLREAVADSPWVEDVSIIEGEAQRCRRIIEGLLNFAASGDSQPVEVDLNALVRETFALAVRDSRAQALTAEWALDPHLPELWIDPRQMQQVFLNLLLNAADAMEGRGAVRVRTAESIEGGKRKALVEFADHGCGISAADLDHIFDPFYTTKKGGAGFGLGLAVSYGIVAAHGGDISVASELGRGSVFTITLPVQTQTTQVERSHEVR